VILEQIVRIKAITLTATEQTLYTNANGAVVRTIMLYNTNTTDTEITLNLDGVIFLFKLATKETKILDIHVVSNLIKATGLGINIHISGIQMEAII